MINDNIIFFIFYKYKTRKIFYKYHKRNDKTNFNPIISNTDLPCLNCIKYFWEQLYATRWETRSSPQCKSFIRIIFSCIFHNCFFTSSSSHAGLKRVHLVGYSRRNTAGHGTQRQTLTHSLLRSFPFLLSFSTRFFSSLARLKWSIRNYGTDNTRMENFVDISPPPRVFFSLLLHIVALVFFFPPNFIVTNIIPRTVHRNFLCYKSWEGEDENVLIAENINLKRL